jgi:hypothetical protein
MRNVGGRATLAIILFVSAIAVSCDSGSQLDLTGELPLGTWGGDEAGLVLSDTHAHVHVGCTFGDFDAPIPLDAERRFSVSGEYALRAYPVQVGPTLPAQFAGVVRNDRLTMTVAVNDTIEGKLVVLGPVTVELGREPEMAMCPICEPGEDT